MADILCPTCSRPNPEELEICQYCGSFLTKANSKTEPLGTLRPGETPTRKATSDLERTLPGWLRNIRRGETPEAPPAAKSSATPVQKQPETPPPPPPAPKKKESSSPLDFLAGLSQSNEDEEESVPDWMAGLRSTPPPMPTVSAPAASEPTPPKDWLAGLQDEPAAEPSAETESNLDWGFGPGSALEFNIEETPATGDTPDWLASLKAQDTTSQAPGFTPPATPERAEFLGSENIPGWLSGLEAETPPSPPPTPKAPPVPQPAPRLDFAPPPPASDVPDWLSDLGQAPAAPAVSQPAAPVPVQPQSFDSDIPDWLSGLGQEEKTPAASKPMPGQPPVEELPLPGQFSPDNDIPAWLGGLEQEPAASAPAPVGDLPDWLGGLTETPAAPVTAPQPPVEAAPADDLSDWLSGLDKEPTESATTIQAAAGEAPFGGDMPDWLGGLTETPAAPTLAPQPPVEAAPAGDLSDWLSGLEKEPTESATTIQAAAGEAPFDGDVPDWLGSLTETPAAPVTAPQPPAEAAPADDLSDWLSGLDKEPTESATTIQAADGEAPFGGDMPDWLGGLTETPAAPVTAPQPPAEAAPAGNLSDWLSGLDKEPTESATTIQAAAGEAPFGGDMPDWLGSLGQEPTAPTPPAETAPAGESPFGGDLSDWLGSLESAPATPTPAPTPEPEPPAPDMSSTSELPDWMGGRGKPKPTPPPPSEPSAPAQAGAFVEGELPDWLSATMGAAQAAPAQQPQPAEQKTPKAFPTGALGDLGLGQTDEVPDWLSGLTPPTAASAEPAPKKEKPAARPAEPVQPPPAFDLSAGGLLDELPDWLGGLGESPENAEGQATVFETATKPPAALESAAGRLGTAPEAGFQNPPEEPDSGSVLSMEVPDWLSGFTPEADKTQPVEEAEQAGIGQAQLPSWVQAMRPMEAVITGDDREEGEQEVEQEGPLAGLRGVLPVQAGLAEIRKPKPYSLKLLADATQQQQAALLENLIASEAASRPVVTKKPVLTIRPLRWIIALVLLLAVFVPGILGPVISGSYAFPLPTAPVAEMKAFHDTIAGLYDEAPVLVVFDYQPGYAGELESAAEPVIDHLMVKNARLAFVSSSPSGSLMVGRMIAKMHTIHGNYAEGTQYIDLGYLPGGAAGIQVFANDPQKTLGSAVLKQQNVISLWDSRPLAGVQNLADFATVVVLTDNPDTGRLWVEQAAPQMGSKPMLMVISAQGEPMIRPYYLSGQLRGIVTGLEGGAAYEQLTSRLGQARRYWDSYGLGMMAAEFLIIFGGAWALFTGLRDRRSRQEEDED